MEILLQHFQVPNTVLTILKFLLGTLVFAQLIITVICKIKPSKNLEEVKSRIYTWWIIFFIFSLAIFSGRSGLIILIGIISFLGLKEFFSLIPIRKSDRRVVLWAFIAIPIQYYWVYAQWYSMFLVFIPVWFFLFLPARTIFTEETKYFLKAVSSIQWGLMLSVFSLSHMAYLANVPHSSNPVAGGVGLLLYLIMLTELNDVFQFLWGKSFGKHKITPVISPKKTWEGFLGGLVSTMILSAFVAPYLTPFALLPSILFGAALAIGGFIGDVVVSAIKRDIGVKDSGTLLPGHGGILDRIDSLTYTSLLFFHLYRYYYL